MSSYISGATLNMGSPYAAYAYGGRSPVNYGYPAATGSLVSYAPPTQPAVTYMPVYYVPVNAAPAPGPASGPASAPATPPAPVAPPVPSPAAKEPTVPPPVPIETTLSDGETAITPIVTKPSEVAAIDAKPTVTATPKTPRQLHRDKVLEAAKALLEANPALENQVFDALPEKTLDEAIAAKGDPDKLIQVALKAAVNAKADEVSHRFRSYLPRILGGTRPAVVKTPAVTIPTTLLDAPDTELNLSA